MLKHRSQATSAPIKGDSVFFDSPLNENAVVLPQLFLSRFVRAGGVLVALVVQGVMQLSLADGNACQSAGCAGITYLASVQTPESGVIKFEVESDDPLSQAFANQVIDLVSKNLLGWADVSPSPPGMDALGNLKSGPAIIKDGMISTFQADALDTSVSGSAVYPEPSFQWTISGSIVQQQQELTELSLTLTRTDTSEESSQSLTIRSGIRDWDRAAHYLSDLLFENFAVRHGLFQSQVLFIAKKKTEKGVERRLALMDQSGDGLDWIGAAGMDVGFASFLETRFDVAYLDQSNGQKNLIYYNLLTDRATPLVQLPDLIGRPDVGAAGRFIAFASAEQASDKADSHNTDMVLVDVEAAVVQTVSNPGTREKDPSFSPDLSALAMVSADDIGSKILIVSFQEPLKRRDRTKGESPLAKGSLETLEIYESPQDLSHPAWSSDGQFLAFIERGVTQDHLMILDLKTHEARKTVSGEYLAHPVWSPHPDFIALIARSEDQGVDQLVRLDLARGLIHILPTPFEPDVLAWSPHQP